MEIPILTDRDRELLAFREIDEASVEHQLEFFEKGAANLELTRPATLGDGITVLDETLSPDLERRHWEAAEAGRIMKFVPASGAATRMFAALTKYLNEGPDRTSLDALAQSPDKTEHEVSVFLSSLKRFAFYPGLSELLHRAGFDADQELKSGNVKTILDYVLTRRGFDYAQLPKALIPFHAYDGYARTSLEEQLVEAAHYALGANARSRIHFTVSPEHLSLVECKINEVIDGYQTRYQVQYDIPLSVQSPATDTIAVDSENRPFRDSTGRLLFRPAGHGALLGNLDRCSGDIVFIKNIDNVVPDHLKSTTVCYKILLAGCLLTLQMRIFSSLEALSKSIPGKAALQEIYTFAADKLNIRFEEGFPEYETKKQARLLLERLNRPIRVCGMVRNEGEPGGGPFWVRGKDGLESLQIVETAQVDLNDSLQKQIVERSTHFNPVDIVCGLRDYQGRPFALHDFTDKEAVFISRKFHEGKPIKALEMPGLWNGGMASWITVFIEVPIETFNPVKVVNDLLRVTHQPL